VPKLCLVALAAAVLLPELVGALSYPVLCLIGMVFHIMALTSFSNERIRAARWLIEGRKGRISNKLKVFLDIIVAENMYDTSIKLAE
jgi:hypothetical protein